jgi:hypothetical protein
MKHFGPIALPLALVVLILGGAPLSAATLVYTPIPFHYNGFHDGAGDTSTPAGNVTLGGVPFSIPQSPNNNTWYSSNVSGDGTNPLTIPVNKYGVQEVDTLIVTQWGKAGSTVTLEFFGGGGAYQAKVLVGDADIRNWLNDPSGWTHYINGTTTINVYTGPSPIYSNLDHYIDKQRIELGPEFAHQTLTHIILTDNGADYSQRAFLYGVSVGAVPRRGMAPASLLLLD